MWKNIFSTGTNRGFSLIEFIVAMFLFSIIITSAGAAFVFGLKMQQRALNIQKTQENANFVFETFLKEIRVSKITSVDSANCPVIPDPILSITHPVMGEIEYKYDKNKLGITRSINKGAATLITSDTVEFTKLGFCISGTGLGDQKQPRITIIASVRSKNQNQQSVINLQTSISPREITD